MRLEPAERETCILFSDADNTASVYTYDKRLIRKLNRLCHRFPEQIRELESPGYGARKYLLPKRCVTVRNPVSDDCRETARLNAKEIGIIPPNRRKKDEPAR